VGAARKRSRRSREMMVEREEATGLMMSEP